MGMKSLTNEETESAELFREDIVFYAKIPKSTIVYYNATKESADIISTTDSIRFQQIAGALYEKYIKTHSELELNISWGLRNIWDSLHRRNYPQEDWKELQIGIDDVISEMIYYIRESYAR